MNLYEISQLISDTKEVGADHMILGQDLEVILTAATADLGPDLVLEVIKGIHILGHTHDLGHDLEVVHLPYQEDKDPHLS